MITVGLITSCTVITALAESTLPFTSVTRSQIVLVPTFEQSKLYLLKVRVAIVQLSVEPLSTCVAVILPLPVASKLTVRFCVSNVGLITS